jgi:hypothetical protein
MPWLWDEKDLPPSAIDSTMQSKYYRGESLGAKIQLMVSNRFFISPNHQVSGKISNL